MTADEPPAAPASESLGTLRRLHDLEVGSERDLAKLREEGAQEIDALRVSSEEAIRAARERADQSIVDSVRAARGAAEAEARLLRAEAERTRPTPPTLGREQRRALRDRVLAVLVGTLRTDA